MLSMEPFFLQASIMLLWCILRLIVHFRQHFVYVKRHLILSGSSRGPNPYDSSAKVTWNSSHCLGFGFGVDKYQIILVVKHFQVPVTGSITVCS